MKTFPDIHDPAFDFSIRTPNAQGDTTVFIHSSRSPTVWARLTRAQLVELRDTLNTWLFVPTDEELVATQARGELERQDLVDDVVRAAREFKAIYFGRVNGIYPLSEYNAACTKLFQALKKLDAKN